jgi:hypothetical protein
LVTETKSNPAKAWLLALVGWLVPGLGHLGQGRVLRGALGGATVLLMFLAGAALGGHLYSLRDTSEGLLSILFGFCDMGSGILCLGSKFMGLAVTEHPQLSTAEYGNVFLEVAGLLNFILALDAFDIGVGRKA